MLAAGTLLGGAFFHVADGIHNLIGGLTWPRVRHSWSTPGSGLSRWAAAAEHGEPQELGDFGILVHAGWSRTRALLFNLLSALTFLVGGLLAYAVAGGVDIVWLLPFAAGDSCTSALRTWFPS